MEAVNKRLDDFNGDHTVWKGKYEALFLKNEAAIVLHNEVKRVFEEESKNFFNDRLKWKSDSQKQIEEQEKKLRHLFQV